MYQIYLESLLKELVNCTESVLVDLDGAQEFAFLTIAK
jgi:hypothetical protein